MNKIIFNIVSNYKKEFRKLCYERLKFVKFLPGHLNVALFLCVIVSVTFLSMEATISTTPQNGTIQVSSAVELMSALSTATGGETILLTAGNYGDLNLYDKRDPFVKFADNVTIKSADGADPAIFSSVKLTGVENLMFDGVKIDYVSEAGAANWIKAFQITDSHHVAITNSIFDGDLAHGVSDIADGYGTGIGLSVAAGSTDITAENNEFFNWHRAATFGATENLTVRGNDVHSIRSDGFDFANVDNVLIEGNHLHDFNGAPESGDHMDMIQFWTSGTTSPSTNVVIRGNILESAEGSWTQSIFMRNEEVDLGRAGQEMFYQNVAIEDNVIFNAHIHGITVGETDGLIIRNNTILHNEDTANGGSVYIPTINVKDASVNVEVTNNIVPRLSFESTESRIVENNLIVQRDDPGGANYYGDLFVDALADSQATLADLKAIPGGIIEQMGVGSSLTKFDGQPDTLNGFVADKAGIGLDLLKHSFDVAKLFGPEGAVDTTGARVAWDFGDGTKAEGPAPSHSYAHAGDYIVTATVTLSDGRSVTIDKTIAVQTPIALDANFDSGAQDLSDNINPVVVGDTVTFEEGLTGQAVRLNGGLVSYDASPDFFNNSEYTLSFDFKKDAGAEDSDGRVINFSGSFVLTIQSNGVHAAVSTSAGTTWLKANGIGIKDADWHRVTLTFSGEDGTALLYVDGKEVSRAEGLQGAIQVGLTSHDLHLGNPWGQGFPGLIDNVKFVRGAMSGEQIQSWGQTWETITTPETPAETNSAPDQSDQLDPASTLEQPAAPDPYADLTEIVMDQTGAIVGGTAGDDLFTGSEVRDVAKGLAGDDVFLMGDGDDYVNAGDGDDEMHGGAGDDYLHGFAGYDTAYGGDGNDTIYANLAYGEAGDDTLKGEDGIADTLFGGEGNDSLGGYGGDDHLFGDGGDDLLNGADGADVLDGGDGADTLWGGSGNDILLGGAGADLIGGGGGDDFIDGGEGADVLGGGDGDDTFVLDVLDSVHGHGGTDTLLFAEGDASNVELSALDIYSIEAVDMRNGAANTLSLSYRNILQSENDTLIIRGDAEDKVILFETMEHLGTIEMNGETFQHYAFSQWSHYTELFVDTDIQIEFPHSDPDALV